MVSLRVPGKIPLQRILCIFQDCGTLKLTLGQNYIALNNFTFHLCTPSGREKSKAHKKWSKSHSSISEASEIGVDLAQKIWLGSCPHLILAFSKTPVLETITPLDTAWGQMSLSTLSF